MLKQKSDFLLKFHRLKLSVVCCKAVLMFGLGSVCWGGPEGIISQLPLFSLPAVNILLKRSAVTGYRKHWEKPEPG